MRVLDLRHAAGDGGNRVYGGHGDRGGAGGDAGMVQEGGMAGMKNSTHLWPVDKVVLGYFACAIVVLLGWWSRIPDAGWLLIAHIVGGAVIVYQVKRPNPTSWVFRNWYP